MRVPDASPIISFTLAGPATLLGLGDGDQATASKGPTHTAYRGRGFVALQVGDAPGPSTLTAAPGLLPATSTLTIR